MRYDDMHWADGAWVGMSVMMLVFWVVLIAAVVWAVLSIRNTERRATTSGSGSLVADELLAARFARGEIDAEEFQRRHEMLRATQRLRR